MTFCMPSPSGRPRWPGSRHSRLRAGRHQPQEGFVLVTAHAQLLAVLQGEYVMAVEPGVDRPDPRDVDEVAARLSALLGDSTTHTSMGMAARARAVGEFDYSVLVARLTAMLQF